MFALVVRFDLKDMTAVDAFDALVAELLPEISVKEPGTLVYTVHSVTGAPLSRVFYECYANEEAFHTHGTYPHTRRFPGRAGDAARRETGGVAQAHWRAGLLSSSGVSSAGGCRGHQRAR